MKTLKIPFLDIQKNGIDYTKLNNCRIMANDISFIGSMFIRDFLINLQKNNCNFDNLIGNSINESIGESGNKLIDDSDNESIDDSDIFEPNKQFIKMALKAVSKDGRIAKNGKEIERNGPKPKGKQLKLYNLFQSFYDDIFSKKFPNQNIDNKVIALNLSFILDEIAVEMETSYSNNIRLNYFKLIHQFINEYFIKKTIIRLSTSNFKKLSDEEKIKYRISIDEENKKNQLIKKELKQVKMDIVENTLLCDEKYHIFVKEFKKTMPILPENMKSYVNYVDLKPFKFINHLIMLNNYLEKNTLKLFQPLPVRTSLGNRYIPINSNVLRDIFCETRSNLTNDQLWEKYFNIDKKKYKFTDYIFAYSITTNGKDVSIRFIKNENVIKKQIIDLAKKNGRNNARIEYKGKTEKEKDEIKKTKNEKKINDKIKKKEIDNLKKKENQEKFKKMDKEQQDKIKAEMKKKKRGAMYIEDAVNDPILLKELKEAWINGEIVVDDPGKRYVGSFFGKGKQTSTMKGKQEIKKNDDTDTGDIFKFPTENILYSYGTKRRLKETQRLKHNEIIDEHKKTTKIGAEEKTIKERETKLCDFSSKSVDPKVFDNYVKEKLSLFYDLKKEETYVKKLDQLNWYLYINTKRHESTILNELKEIYGKNAIFIIGDWSKGDKIKYISTPNSKMLKLLATRFTVYLIDEYKTSKLYYLNDNIEKENFKMSVNYTNKEGKKITYNKEIHAVLTFQMTSWRKDIINRDYNAVLNMKKIVEHLIMFKTRPENFRRGYIDPKKENPKKLNRPKHSNLLHEGKRSVGVTKLSNFE